MAIRVYPTPAPVVGGANPTDAFSIRLATADTNPVPSDSPFFQFTFPDTNVLPTDAALLNVSFPDTNTTPTDLFNALTLSSAETNSTPTETSTLTILGQADTNALPTDTHGLTVKGLGDSSPTPTEARTSTSRHWCGPPGGAAASGTNVTTPGNADGVNNGTTASIKTSVAGAASITLTANPGPNVPAGTPITTCRFVGYYQYVSGTNNNYTITATWTGGSAVVANFASPGVINALTTPRTFDLFAAGCNTLAKVQSLVFTFNITDSTAGLGGTLTVDAAHIELTGVI